MTLYNHNSCFMRNAITINSSLTRMLAHRKQLKPKTPYRYLHAYNKFFGYVCIRNALTL